MSHYIFYGIIFILITDFIFERYLSFLNIQHSKKSLPLELQNIYDDEAYLKQQAYFRANVQFGILKSGFVFLLTLLMYSFGGFAWFDSCVREYIENPIAITLVFFALLYLAYNILSIPFECYDVFSIEEQFGLNKLTPKIFVLDKLKSCLLAFSLGGVLLTLIVWIYTLTPDYFWLLAFATITVFSLFITMFYSEVIVPIFNKQTPLAEGELREAIEEFAGKAGFKLENIYVIDGSKRSTKANAYFAGLGSKKRIVLYDTLMDTLTTNEIVAVLAHEIGHYKHKHTLKHLFVSLPTTLLLFIFLGYVLKSDSFAQALGAEKASFHLNVLVFSILYVPVSTLLGLLQTILSRRFEYQADDFAAGYNKGVALISALKKLSSTSLSNLAPHPAYVFFHYSHPTLYQRILNLQNRRDDK